LVAAGAALLWALFRLWATRRACANAVEAERTARASIEAAEGRTAQVRAMLDAVLCHCGCGAAIVNREGLIEAINRDAVALLDVAVPNPVGHPLADVVIGTEVPELLRKARSQDTAISAEIQRVGPSNDSTAVVVGPVAMPDGPAGWVVIAHDITTRRRLEAIRRDFVANVSHELRTPMASIRAMAETLRDGALADTEVAQRFLGTIVTEAERLTRISEDLLTLSDAESRPPERTDFSLSALASHTVRRLEAQAARAGLDVRVEADGDVRAWGSRDQIEQVVLNLVDNAVKYTPSGGSVVVRVRIEGARAVLSVTDTGIGILQEHLPRVFERFYRVDKARSRQSGGTGLGLAIVKNIVEAHGGSVSAESEYNTGSTFTMALPRSADAL
jgi:two-component system phosphate regulon sensor histidine kinase PhoR